MPQTGDIKPKAETPCPNCGRCPTCGHGPTVLHAHGIAYTYTTTAAAPVSLPLTYTVKS